MSEIISELILDLALASSQNQSLILVIKVIPKSSINKIITAEKHPETKQWHLKIKLNAIPEKGKANQKLVKYLAKTLNLSPSNFELLQGSTNQNKIICIKP